MVKEKSTILEIILMRITEMNDKELNELRERINKEYDKRQEERRRVVETIKKDIFPLMKIGKTKG